MSNEMKKPEEVTTKNTKNEILAAYNRLLTQVKKLQCTNREQQRSFDKQKKLVDAVGKESPKTIQNQLTALRERMNDEISTIGEEIEKEMQRLTNVQDAIRIEEDNLKELYEINKTAHTLDVLLLANKQERENFNQEMVLQRSNWKSEQDTFIRNMRETQENTKKEWAREKDEYLYSLKTSRQKEQDEYNAKRAKQAADLEDAQARMDNEFQSRELALKEKELEMEQLRNEVGAFPERMKKEIDAATKRVMDELNKEHKFKFDLMLKEREGEKKLASQMIASLEAKIKSQEAVIQQLNEKASSSVGQVKEIALKAIDGKTPKNFYYAKEAGEQA